MYKNAGEFMIWVIKIIIVTVVLLQYLTLTAYAQSSINLERAKAAERQKMERVNYERACEKGTIEALKEYIVLYPNGRFTDDAKKRIADYRAWSRACDENTIDAYNTYIETSEYKVFSQAAKDSIAELESIVIWNRIMDEPSLSAMEEFIHTYPNSSRIGEAQRVKHELTAVILYGESRYKDALEEFDAAGGRLCLATANVPKYDECTEEVDYQSTNDDMISLTVFLIKHPQGKHYEQISNRLAILKAKQLDYTSDENAYNDAINYVKDVETKRIVERYINAAKQQRISYERRWRAQLRRQQIRANGGYVMLGIEACDFLLGVTEGGNTVLSYNVGVSMKIGNYKAPVQFEVGIKPGIMYWIDDYDDYDLCRFHMPVYAKLKLNLAGDNCKFYIAGLGFYNAIRDEDFESKFSVGGGFGVAWKKLEIFPYYKQDINEEKYDYSTGTYYFCGFSFIVYL